MQQILVISSPLSDFLALWSSHCRAKIGPIGLIPSILIAIFCCVQWHVESPRVVMLAGYHTVAVDSLGDAYCFGDGKYGQLGLLQDDGARPPLIISL